MENRENRLILADKPVIVLEQLPIITSRLKELADDISGKVAKAEALLVTADSKQAAKELKATLNKERDYYENIRKEIKTAILAPYEEFNAEYDRVIKAGYDTAEKILKDKIHDIESVEITEKTTGIQAYFAEYLSSKDIDFVDFSKAGLKVNLTTTLAALKKSAKEYIDHISDDLALIDTQELKTEILVEYKNTLNVAQAITVVTARRKAIEEETARRAECVETIEGVVEVVKKVVELAPPVVEVAVDKLNEEIFVLSFRVRATRQKLQDLKQFLKDRGYECERVTS